MTSLWVAVAALAAVAGWTAWEAAMAARLRRHSPRGRTGAVNGALRLVVLGQLALISLCTGAAVLAGVPLWRGTVTLAPVTSAAVAVAVGLVALLATVVMIGWLARRGLLRGRWWALAATALGAAATEVAWRGLALGSLSAAGVPLTVSVALAAVAGGLVQAWRSEPGSRVTAATWSTVLGFLLGLVTVVTGSVPVSVALHVAVAVAVYARTLLPPAVPEARGSVVPAGAVAGTADGGAVAGPAAGTADRGAVTGAAGSEVTVRATAAGAGAAAGPAGSGTACVSAADPAACVRCVPAGSLAAAGARTTGGGGSAGAVSSSADLEPGPDLRERPSGDPAPILGSRPNGDSVPDATSAAAEPAAPSTGDSSSGCPLPSGQR